MEKRSHHFLLLLLLKLLISKMAAAQIIPVRVGTVLGMDEYGEGASNCISLALSDFYSTHNHYTTRLLLTHRRSKEGVVAAAAAGWRSSTQLVNYHIYIRIFFIFINYVNLILENIEALDLLKNVEVQAIIGPTFSTQANFLISLGDKAQVPIITFSATSPSLTSIRSPYFVRATLNDSSQVDAIGAIVKEFGWREVVPVYEDNEFGEGIMPHLADALEEVNARIPYRSVIPPLATDDQIEAELYKLMTMQTRVFIVHMMSPLASRLFTKARQIGLMSQEYAWIVTNGIMNELNSLYPSVVESMLGVIGVRPYVLKTRELESFEIRYKIQARNAAELDIFGLWAYDSAIALAMAAEKANLRDLKYHDTNTSMNSTDLEGFGVSNAGPELIKALSSTTFIGLAGNFKLVDGQLQQPPLEIVNFVGHGVRSIGYWMKENGIVKELMNSTSKSKLASIIWPGDRTSPPKGWVIPTNGRKLRVGVPIKAGFTEFVRVTWNPNNSTTVEGYCIDVFDAVMAALPYGVPYEYIPFANPDHSMAGNYNDMTYQVYLGVSIYSFSNTFRAKFYI